MEPTGNGIGGDLFAIVWDAKTEKLYALNASGRSPKSLTLEYFKENGCTIVQVEVFAPNRSAHDFYLGRDYEDRSMFMLKLLE